MIVPSFYFLAFSAVAALPFHLTWHWTWCQRVVLLAVDIAFLGSFALDPISLLPFAGFILLGYAGVRLIQGGIQKACLPFVIAILLAFFWLKQYAFVPAASLLPFSYVTVGMSYVFFRVLHLNIDARDRAFPRVNILDYLNYTLNFTCLVAGPIQRFEDYKSNGGSAPLPLDIVEIGVALERIVVGFFKVSIVCLVLSAWQKSALAALAPSQSFVDRVETGAAIAVLYPLYLYFNFSGYTDVVIGVARFFGLILPENFDRPFAADNFIDFWSRWHITLSRWLRAYVFTPLFLTMMRRVQAPAVRPYVALFPLFLTFFLIGVWHGQTIIFIVFGLLQGLGVSVNSLYQILMTRRLGRNSYLALCDNIMYRTLTRGLTFAWFAFTLFCFWSSFDEIGRIVAALGPAALLTMWLVVIVGASLVIALKEQIRAGVLGFSLAGASVLMSRYVRTAWVTALVACTCATMVLLNAPAPDIVYKGF